MCINKHKILVEFYICLWNFIFVYTYFNHFYAQNHILDCTDYIITIAIQMITQNLLGNSKQKWYNFLFKKRVTIFFIGNHSNFKLIYRAFKTTNVCWMNGINKEITLASMKVIFNRFTSIYISSCSKDQIL